MNKRYMAALLGNTMQFYDFTLFAFLTSEISKTFFNFDNPFLSSFVVLGIFASGYLTRPLGSLIFGYLGDKAGRSHALSKTILISALTTFGMGIIPGYALIGYWAPCLLILMRLLQGLAVSGEEGGAVVLLFEQYAFKHRGMLGASVLSSVLLGVVLGIFICTVITWCLAHQLVGSWGWRIPFILSLPLGLVAIVFRYYLNDFKLFDCAKTNNVTVPQPTKSLFLEHTWSLLYGFCLVAIYSITTSTLIVHLPYYLTTQLHLAKENSLLLAGLAILFVAGLTPLIGKFGERFNPHNVYKSGSCGIILASPLLFYVLERGEIYTVISMILVFSCLISLLSAALFHILVGLFPFGVRYSGVSLAFNTSVTLFSSTTPLILMSLENTSSYSILPGLYIGLLSWGLLILTRLVSNKVTVWDFSQSDNERLIYQNK